MAQLTALQSGLNKVRRYRTTARLASAGAMFVSIVLWVLLIAFALDVTLKMGVFERGIVLLLFGAALLWSMRRYVLPAMTTHEDQASLALMVERQQGISSDLVAALQFADDKRPQFGSSDLRHAVVDTTAEVCGDLDYLEGFSRQDMARRVMLMAATIVIALIPAVAFAEHTAVFFNRFMLGAAHYPTKTIIEDVVAPGERAPYGQPLKFQVRVGGEVPTEGVARVESVSSGLGAEVVLEPDENDPTLFVGTLPRVMDELRYTLEIGDAYTDPRTVELIPLPVVDLNMRVELPAYAKGRFSLGEGSSRQPVALEGSRVTPTVTADKPLKSVSLKVAEETHALRQDGQRWVLDTKDTLFERVDQTVRYELDVVDADGLKPERALTGVVQVRSDQPPRIGAATVTQYVLPTAAPSVRIQALDDYGLSRIVVHRAVVRQQRDETGVATAEAVETQDVVAQPPNHGRVADNQEAKARWEHPGLAISLADLKLVKGDRVIVVLEAVDYRGAAEGKASRSDKMVFQVTDRAGVLAALRELDARMDKKLDQIIKAQLGIGDQP